MVSIQEWQLLSVFAVEPSLLDEGVPWAYNRSTYRVTQGEHVLDFTLEPAGHEVQILLSYQGRELYELDATTVVDVEYVGENQRDERIDISFDKQYSGMSLYIRPQIRIVHNYHSN